VFWSCFSEDGALWRGPKAFSGTDDKYPQMLEEQEALQDAAQGAGTKHGPNQPVKRSIKGGPKGPSSTSPHVNSGFTKSIVCECTIIVYPGTASKNATIIVFLYSSINICMHI